MALLNRLFNKRKKSAAKPVAVEETVAEKKPQAVVKIPVKPKEIKSNILLSSHTAEKALAAQKLNQYVFKVNSDANKIIIMNEVKKNYNVKVLKVNVINIPKKVRRIGKSQGFKAGYKKAIVTLAPGETIEMTK